MARGARTIYTVRALGHNQRSWFANADRVLVNSDYLTRTLAASPEVRTFCLPSPFVWPEIQRPDGTGGFVTLVNAAPHIGLVLFARLADMLRRRRPDILLLIVQSGGDVSMLHRPSGVDLARHGNVLVSPTLPEPRQIYALTRILLVPSVFEEPFGRVAAETMISGIPPIVSDRGGLPETVGEGALYWVCPAGSHRPPSAF
jgi:glycosyltransferase involved in cell wall biosynthesis